MATNFWHVQIKFEATLLQSLPFLTQLKKKEL